MGGALRVGADGREALVPSGGQAEIGRAETCAIRLDDPRVSRVHAVVWEADDGWHLADRGSTFGTFRAGEPVEQLRITGLTTVRLGDPEHGPVVELTPVSVPDAPAGPGRGTRGPTGTFHSSHVADARVRIGRDDDNDVVLDDLQVSRHHAELRRTGDGWEVVDLGSTNGTFVNGAPVQRGTVVEGDLIGIGHSELRLLDGRLEEYVDAGEITFEAEAVTVTAHGGRMLVDHVSFALEERSLFAVVGPSGSGKSTLLGALAGTRPFHAGRVLYGGRDLIADYAELRHRVGLVPQDDVLHGELELRRALEYAGRLRFPPDVSAEARNERVDEVLAELGIAHRASSPIDRLSGGERKRTNVALELLTKPSLLFLDEPVSGLDPGRARSLMQLLRDLADDGRTVVVVTHELAGLAVCDQILVLAPGGVPAYVGPPEGAPARFGADDLVDVFGRLAEDPLVDWHVGRARAASDTPTVDELPVTPVAPVPAAGPTAPAAPAVRQGWWSQLRTLTARYAEVLASDRRNALLLLLQAPVLGLLLLAALPAGELGAPPPTELRLVSAAGIVLFVLLVGATWLGANNAIREIARELPVLRRERAAGLSLSAYVASKAIVLGALTVVQAVVLVALATLRQDGPSDAVVLGWAPGELMVVVALAGLAAMALGLLISALAGSPERATSILPIVLILQLVLGAGVVLPEIVDKPVLNQL
ncbi:MAG TPA: FHA domain-containing protein, partial [Acidimicrobiales bacterium]|nr:FHA domain-containing protein [Acidimicrobiales bacterium]